MWLTAVAPHEETDRLSVAFGHHCVVKVLDPGGEVAVYDAQPGGETVRLYCRHVVAFGPQDEWQISWRGEAKREAGHQSQCTERIATHPLYSS